MCCLLEHNVHFKKFNQVYSLYIIHIRRYNGTNVPRCLVSWYRISSPRRYVAWDLRLVESMCGFFCELVVSPSGTGVAPAKLTVVSCLPGNNEDNWPFQPRPTHHSKYISPRHQLSKPKKRRILGAGAIYRSIYWIYVNEFLVSLIFKID